MKNIFNLLENLIGQIDGPDGPTTVFGFTKSDNEQQNSWEAEQEFSCEKDDIILRPLEGIEWNGNFISLGCSKVDVEGIFGNPQVVRQSYYYFQNELRFDFDKKGKLEFIEFLGGVDGCLNPVIYGISAFVCDASEVEQILTEKNAGKVDDSEGEYSKRFQDISVGVYREITLSDVLEMEQEMKADGIPTEGNEDLEADRRRANHWGTIGMGISGYYKR